MINESHTNRVQFVNSPDDFYLLDGVPEAIAILRGLGYKIFVVTNQAGMYSGMLSEETLEIIHDKMMLSLLEENEEAVITEIAYCPHNPYGNCDCRKPKPGMILRLAEKHHIDLSQSYMIGDRLTDVEAGESAGCSTYLVDGDHSLLDFAYQLKTANRFD